MCVNCSVMSDSATPWTVTHQVPLVCEISQATILEWLAISFSRGIFPTQGSNLGLLHCRQILYHLGHQGESRLKRGVQTRDLCFIGPVQGMVSKNSKSPLR